MAAAPRRDQRRLGVLLTLLAVIAGGVALDWSASPGDASLGAAPAPPTAQAPAPATADVHPHGAEVRRRFDEAVVMLHARQYEHAATALHRVLALDPTLPEAHANMGFAMMGLARHKEARDFFEGAIALRADQANAYYGLALAHEATGQLELARGAMRTYLHLARDERPEHLARARAALWEWEASTPTR